MSKEELVLIKDKMDNDNNQREEKRARRLSPMLLIRVSIQLSEPISISWLAFSLVFRPVLSIVCITRESDKDMTKKV